jgi:hypothetical protein
MRGSFWLDSAESAGGDFSARVFPYSAVQKYLRLMLRHNTKFEAALHRGHTFAHANPKLSATSTGADLELMRQNDALPYSALLICCAATSLAHHLPIGGGASSPNHEGDHESRPTGSLQVHLGSAILENSARCSGDGDVFLSTPNELSCQGGPIGCAHHAAISDLGRGS